MFNQSLTVETFLPLLRDWAGSRLHPGLTHLSGGWEYMAADDFLAHLHHLPAQTRTRRAPAHQLSYDIECRVTALLGSSEPVTFLLNRHHHDADAWLIQLACQSAHEGLKSFVHRLEAQRHRLLGHAPLPGLPPAHAALIAICVDPATKHELQRHHGFHLKFELPQPAVSLDQAGFFFLSTGIDRSHHY